MYSLNDSFDSWNKHALGAQEKSTVRTPTHLKRNAPDLAQVIQQWEAQPAKRLRHTFLHYATNVMGGWKISYPPPPTFYSITEQQTLLVTVTSVSLFLSKDLLTLWKLRKTNPHAFTKSEISE